jgi:hypothetical protein
MVKKGLLVTAVFFIINASFAQQYVTTGDFDRTSKISFGASFNVFNGELREVADPNIQGSLGFTLGYEHFLRSSKNISLRGNLSVYSIKGSDELAPVPERESRNLSFKATNFEFTLQALYHLRPLPSSGYKDRAFLNPYVMLGAGVTSNNPKAELNGVEYKLRPMRLEGEEYGSLAVVIPVGLGLNFFLNRLVDFQIEAQYNMALTGYLDDVSTVYRDPISFADPIAAQLSDRRPEISLPPAAAGDPRGAGKNDAYFRIGFRLNYYLPKSLYGKSALRCIINKKTR